VYIKGVQFINVNFGSGIDKAKKPWYDAGKGVILCILAVIAATGDWN
jgi:hypothetical protein